MAMKKVLFILLLAVLLIVPVSAKTNLLNLGYNIHGKYFEWEGLKLRSIGLSYTHLGGDTTGFYAQINPYFGLSERYEGVTNKLSDYGITVIGSNFILGYGGDINFGSMGLILGGGLFLDALYDDYSGGYVMIFSTGLGVGANFYFQPGAGNFVVNAGLSLAWRPFSVYVYEFDSFEEFDAGKTNVNFNIGVGWRTGGIGSGRSSSKSSDGGDSDDEW